MPLLPNRPTEAARIRELRPRQQALLKRPDLSRVITLTVDAESHRLYANRSDVTAVVRAEEEAPSWSVGS